MVCSCAMSSTFVWLQIPVIFCSWVNETTLFSFLRLLLCESDRALHFAMKIFIKKKNKLGDRMIKQLLNSSVARYRDLSVSRRSMALMRDCVRRVNFTTKPRLKAKFFAFALFMRGYSFQLYCPGNSFMQNFATLYFENETWW